MRANGARDIEASAWTGGNQLVQIRIGVHRYTATRSEAIEFARQLIDAAEVRDE